MQLALRRDARPVQLLAPRAEGLLDQRLAVEVEQVEREERDPHLMCVYGCG
eukprot:COSAG01_NODE_1148_length_11519_cov_3.641944_22_plen_51_part_00